MKNKNRCLRKCFSLILPVFNLVFWSISCGSSAQSVQISTPTTISTPEQLATPSPQKSLQTLNSQLVEAINNKDPTLVKDLLQKGASANAKTEDSQNDFRSSVLLLAVDNDSLPIVEILLKKGANPNIGGYGSSWFPATPLGSAVLNDNLDIAEALLKKGANIKKPAFMDEPLSFIADDEKSIDFLIKHGMDINAENYFGGTALIRATERNEAQSAELLIKKGANVNYKRKDGETPYTLAKFYENKDAIALLEKYGAKDTYSPLLEFAAKKPSSKAEIQLKKILTGKWKKEGAEGCFGEDCLDIQFDKTDESFCVIDNQIFVSVYYRLDLKKQEVFIFFKRTTDLGRGGLGMGWDRYDRKKPIGIIDISNLKNEKIVFKWIGFSYKDIRYIDMAENEYRQGIYIKYIE